MDIFDSSDKLRELEVNKPRGFVSKYPWDNIAVGKSFAIVDKSTITLQSLRSLAWRTGQKLNKEFRVVEHDNCYEVGRIDSKAAEMRQELGIEQQPKNIVEALKPTAHIQNTVSWIKKENNS